MCKAKYLILNIIALFYIATTINNIYAKPSNSDKLDVIINNTEESPTIVVKTVTEKLIEKFKQNASSYRKNEKIMYDQVGKILFDIIAFNSVSVSIMGKHAKKANEKQIKRFSELLKDNLIQFYSRVFLEFEADKFIIANVTEVSKKTINEYKQGKRRIIPVTLSISKKDEKYTVKYSLIQSDNKWKLKNITFNNINVGVQLRNRFSEIYDKEKDISKTIDAWVNNIKL
jgi:ABC-type transporter MlaC component